MTAACLKDPCEDVEWEGVVVLPVRRAVTASGRAVWAGAHLGLEAGLQVHS